ncbi:Gamma-aminobutyric acid receptor subunit epsilon [Portunus trituberculatus]|uniref:Gamma-aminobutyric acid receptor subunit epsilon n=1 Tax=Portunus trituberculatus TaxID=210409 RepID=A0A5B7FJA0_PORTR|nr:Gamma-aminobutyric acid receptor subunit epsilon [Portunus trituberculatus]
MTPRDAPKHPPPRHTTPTFTSNATVLWGYHLGSQLYDYHSFNGFVAAVSRSASLNDPALLPSSCLAMVRVAEDMKSLESWRRFGNIFLEEMDDTVVCEEEELDVTLTGPMDYENFDRRCRGLGGRLLTQDERDQGRDMEAGQLQEEEKMDQNSDINETGLVKKEEVDQGKQLYTYLFSGDSADLNSTARCTALVGDSVTELPCVTDLHSTLCRVPASLLYTLFGDIEGFDHHYTLKLVPEGFFFEGRDGLSNISEVDGAWVLWSSLHHRRWNLMHSWPMGRRQWRSPRPAMITPLTLSSCNSLEFSSNDGLCYLSYFRCDGLLQITDGSDEESCHVPFFIPSDDQRSFNPFPEFSRSEVEYTMDIINIGKMTSLEDMAVMEILFDFSWHDFRLNFVFHNELDNIFPCMHAWTPHVLVFAGSPAGQMIHSKSTSSKCYVRWHNEGETLRHHRNLTDPYMSRQPEKNAKIWIRKKERLHLASPCNLRLDAFPFGQYQCKVMFELGTDEQMKWVQKTALGDDYQLHYSGKLDLYDYMLDKITVSTRVHRLTLTLYISGQPAHHVLNSFAPSAFMFLISYSTFYFPLTDFNERIMASLTSLLVLVSLSAQSSGNYVRTPYLKAIDLWFVLLIIYCFLVIICNVVVNALLVRENEMKPILVMKISPSGFQGERKRRCRITSETIQRVVFRSLPPLRVGVSLSRALWVLWCLYLYVTSNDSPPCR